MARSRKLLDGRRVKDSVKDGDDPVTLVITQCPAKWLMLDMETGDVFGHDGKNFARPKVADLRIALEVAQDRLSEELKGGG